MTPGSQPTPASRLGRGCALLTAATLALTACGSSTTGAPGSSQGDSSQTIHIDTISDLSGPASVIGLVGKAGQETAVGIVNADPKTYLCSPDRKLELTYDDGTNAPTTAVTIARNYVSSGQNVGVIGPLFTAQAQAMGPVMTQAKIPMLVPYTPGSKELSGLGDYVFAQSQPDSQSAETGVDAMLKAWPDSTTIGILFPEDTAATVAQQQYVNELLEQRGKTVVSVGVPFASTDMSSAISTLQSKGAQVVYMLVNAAGIVAAFQEANRGNFSPHWFGYSTMFSPSVAADGGPAAEGALLTADYDPSLNTPLVKEFQQAYQSATGKQPDSWAALGFQSVMTMAAAACQVNGQVTGEALQAALTTVKAPAVISGGTFSFDADRLNATPPAVLEIKGGQFVAWAG